MAETKNNKKPTKKKYQKAEKKPSWATVKSFLTWKNLQTGQQQLQKLQRKPIDAETSKRWKKLGFTGSLCNNTKVMQRPETCNIDDNKKKASVVSCSSNGSISSRSIKVPSNELKRVTRSSSSSALSSSISSRSSAGGSYRGMPLGRFSGCYECRMVDDPSNGVSRRRSSIKEPLCSCPVCGEIFMKPDALEVHQSVRHAVSELDSKDTSRNVVEIIFQSSWLKKQAPNCKIDRILKVNNSRKIITRFEDYTNSIKAKASKDPKKHPRCVADGNELLSIIRNGFKIEPEVGVCTSATSGKAHDSVTKISEGEKRAMLVCRVIAGRVKRNEDTGSEEFDSVAGHAGIYTDLEELFVFNPKSILPCFVVIYSGF
ncbi:zinc finger (C2H2 type) family protein [Thalictrum thalictroides]|uniref:Zinc finger (C2H2 type) family protein n=1 Tax=Thalictrum thalictroides TaxID=46969 RepID=A0A7J6WRE5_THATH|nr:zinc finger (C2H2 type) family protein [Thalictrum thalictroides]